MPPTYCGKRSDISDWLLISGALLIIDFVSNGIMLIYKKLVATSQTTKDEPDASSTGDFQLKTSRFEEVSSRNFIKITYRILFLDGLYMGFTSFKELFAD
eukprot:TRINITY_DN17122_c0_g1_i1.p1 TRINITY_DN17122_c0_g1~~TRINITY_DN17122_c0_g1_i1.p1  ORF type:complete len:100 (-),score=1.73 TRINITY_DN17122_c0_g1_i1:146-445(-)